MDVVLGTENVVAAKDRLYRALDKALEHKYALESYLAQRWRGLLGAKCDLLLYDLLKGNLFNRGLVCQMAAEVT